MLGGKLIAEVQALVDLFLLAIKQCTFHSLTFLLRCRVYLRGAPDFIVIFFIKRVVVPFIFQRNPKVVEQDTG